MASRKVVLDDSDQRIKYSGNWFTKEGSPSSSAWTGPVFQNTLHGVIGDGSMSFLFNGESINNPN